MGVKERSVFSVVFPPPPFFDIYLGAADASRHTTMTREWRERGEGRVSSRE